MRDVSTHQAANGVSEPREGTEQEGCITWVAARVIRRGRGPVCRRSKPFQLSCDVTPSDCPCDLRRKAGLSEQKVTYLLPSRQ